MMTTDMQDYSDNLPPPPPAEPPGVFYRPWSSDPGWGPPQWPPAQPAGRSKAMRRTMLAVLAAACVGVGGGTSWALTSSALSHPTTASLPSGSSVPSGGAATSPANGSGSGSASGGSVAAIDAAVVDINAAVAGSPTASVAGTGMILTSSGEVLTNNHVIDGTVNITAQVDGTGTVYKATVVGYDAADDVALIQLQGASGLPTVPIGDSSKLSVGDSLTVIGNALGRGGTPAEVDGVVAGLHQPVTASDESGDQETLSDMIQVQADIQPGDSGGPEINAAGKVVGMTTAGQENSLSGRQTPGATTGYAIPINKAMQIVSEIRSGGGTNVHIGNAALLGVKVTSGGSNGAAVSGVVAGTPAAAAGLVAGDRITAIGDQTVASSADLHKAMQGFTNGQSVSITWSDATGASHSATITLGTASFAD